MNSYKIINNVDKLKSVKVSAAVSVGLEPGPDSHQVVDLMMPAAGDKQDLSSLLNHLQGATCLTEAREMLLVLQGGGCDIIGQVSTAVPQELLLPRGVQQPFLTPTDVR